jgi:hypothetical protein
MKHNFDTSNFISSVSEAVTRLGHPYLAEHVLAWSAYLNHDTAALNRLEAIEALQKSSPSASPSVSGDGSRSEYRGEYHHSSPIPQTAPLMTLPENS